MSNQYTLAGSNPNPIPAVIPFEGKNWKLWPVDLIGIATELEYWVAQFVRQNVEKLRPGKDEVNPVAWRIYTEDREQTLQNIERGDYAAMMPGWFYILCRPQAPGFREAVYQCMAFKCPDWTREHTARLLADEKRYNEVYARFDEINFPKVQKPGGKDPPPPTQPDPTQSVGEASSPKQQSEASSQASLPA